jgi:hypothetical protein
LRRRNLNLTLSPPSHSFPSRRLQYDLSISIDHFFSRGIMPWLYPCTP